MEIRKKLYVPVEIIVTRVLRLALLNVYIIHYYFFLKQHNCSSTNISLNNKARDLSFVFSEVLFQTFSIKNTYLCANVQKVEKRETLKHIHFHINNTLEIAASALNSLNLEKAYNIHQIGKNILTKSVEK